jgi:hypothetical protein
MKEFIRKAVSKVNISYLFPDKFYVSPISNKKLFQSSAVSLFIVTCALKIVKTKFSLKY